MIATVRVTRCRVCNKPLDTAVQSFPHKTAILLTCRNSACTMCDQTSTAEDYTALDLEAYGAIAWQSTWRLMPTHDALRAYLVTAGFRTSRVTAQDGAYRVTIRDERYTQHDTEGTLTARRWGRWLALITGGVVVPEEGVNIVATWRPRVPITHATVTVQLMRVRVGR